MISSLIKMLSSRITLSLEMLMVLPYPQKLISKGKTKPLKKTVWFIQGGKPTFSNVANSRLCRILGFATLFPCI